MFTTGSKLFLGATVLAIVAAVVYGVAFGGDIGWTGTVGLVSAAVAFAFLAGINFYIRDGNVRAMEPGAVQSAPAAKPAPRQSLWPLFGAVGGGLVVLGAETYPVVFKAGIVVLLATVVEWMIQAWSERASADPAYNDGLRKRLLHPLELPILAAVGLGILVYSFSRIMLYIPKTAGPLVFIGVGAVVLAAGFLFVSSSRITATVKAGIGAVGVAAVVAIGTGMALAGERDIHVYPTSITHPEICAAPGEVDDHELAEIDEKASQTVGAQSNPAAFVTLDGDMLGASQIGLPGGLTEITLARSNASNVIFRNESDEARRFTVNLGAFTTDVNGTAVTTRPVMCTSLVEPGGTSFLTLKFDKSTIDSDEPYTIVVPGLQGQAIEIHVP